jgi:hypothetical protein
MVAPGGIVYKGARTVGTAVQAAATRLAPVDSGRLRQSGDTEVITRQDAAVARVSFSARHALPVHEGTGIYGPRRRPIVPRRARVLSWWDRRSGGRRFARSVRGMRPRRFLTRGTQLVTGKTPK